MASLLVRTGLPALLLVALAGCPTDPALRQLDGADRFLCCTLRFDRNHHQTDANYSFQPQTLLSAGTRVRVVKADSEEVALQPAGDTTVYHLVFHFGRARMGPAQWFGLVLRDADPRPSLDLTPALAAAVVEGRIEVGMTKAQVLAARGYPPFHQTPSVDADRWTYFSSGKVVNEITFTDGRVTAIVNAAAPGA